MRGRNHPGALIALVLVSASSALAARLAVCSGGVADAGVLSRATAEAGRMLTAAGIATEWRGSANCPADAIRITFTDRTPKDAPGEALAYAMPFEGSTIRIFYDRIAPDSPDARPRILAAVLVHEIGHILQGMNRHADEGVMKARWTAKDYTLILQRRLGFTETDIELLQAGIRRIQRNADSAAQCGYERPSPCPVPPSGTPDTGSD